MTISSHQIERYRITCQNTVADKGSNHKTMPKKRAGKGSCTKRPFRDAHGIAQSKTLRKREKRLYARQVSHAATCNSDKNEGRGYRKPGSMR